MRINDERDCGMGLELVLPFPPSANRWSAGEDEFLRVNYLLHARVEIANQLGRTLGSVRKRCSVLGLNSKHPALTNHDREGIKRWYEERQNSTLEEFNLDALANQMNRSKNLISRCAGGMGLTIRGRVQGERIRRMIGDATCRTIKNNGHPKGMLGKKHSSEFSLKQSERVKARVFTKEQTEARVRKANATKIAKYGSGAPHWLISSNPYSRGKRGKRADLENRYFRSSWEANYARYLNFLVKHRKIVAWDYEVKTFVFHGVERGVLTYTPDFFITNSDGTTEWHEVKGWMDAKSIAKLKRMSKFYPNEKIVVVGSKEYRGISKWKKLIGDWE
jgi:hypothetical protein